MYLLRLVIVCSSIRKADEEMNEYSKRRQRHCKSKSAQSYRELARLFKTLSVIPETLMGACDIHETEIRHSFARERAYRNSCASTPIISLCNAESFNLSTSMITFCSISNQSLATMTRRIYISPSLRGRRRKGRERGVRARARSAIGSLPGPFPPIALHARTPLLLPPFLRLPRRLYFP